MSAWVSQTTPVLARKFTQEHLNDIVDKLNRSWNKQGNLFNAIEIDIGSRGKSHKKSKLTINGTTEPALQNNLPWKLQELATKSRKEFTGNGTNVHSGWYAPQTAHSDPNEITSNQCHERIIHSLSQRSVKCDPYSLDKRTRPATLNIFDGLEYFPV